MAVKLSNYLEIVRQDPWVARAFEWKIFPATEAERKQALKRHLRDLDCMTRLPFDKLDFSEKSDFTEKEGETEFVSYSVVYEEEWGDGRDHMQLESHRFDKIPLREVLLGIQQVNILLREKGLVTSLSFLGVMRITEVVKNGKFTSHRIHLFHFPETFDPASLDPATEVSSV